MDLLLLGKSIYHLRKTKENIKNIIKEIKIINEAIINETIINYRKTIINEKEIADNKVI